MRSIFTDGSTNGGIFKFETVLVKKLLNISAILSLFSNMELQGYIIRFRAFFRQQWFDKFLKRLIVNNLLIIQIIVVVFFYFKNN